MPQSLEIPKKLKLSLIRRYIKIIRSQIRLGRKIRLRAVFLNTRETLMLAIIFKELGRFYQNDDIFPFLLTCAREALENGLKANVKRVIFKANNINIEDDSQYSEGLKIFKEMLTPDNISKFIPAAREKGYFAELEISQVNRDALILKIKNNAPLTQIEESRVRKKFASAMAYPSFIDYMNMEIDQSEGSGLGIAMIIAILRKLNIDPASYRIYRTNDFTIVRIVFPISANFKDRRILYRNSLS